MEIASPNWSISWNNTPISNKVIYFAEVRKLILVFTQRCKRWKISSPAVSLCICAHVRAKAQPGTLLRHCPSSVFIWLFLRRDPSLAWNLPSKCGWLSRGPQTCLPPHQDGRCATTTGFYFYTCFLENELRSPYFQGKHSANWAIPPTKLKHGNCKISHKAT